MIPSVSLKHGGPSYAIRSYAQALQDVGVDVTVATTDDDGAGTRLKVPLGVPISVKGVRYLYFRRNIVPYKFSFSLRRWLRGNVESFDVVHIHAVFSFASTVAAKACRRARVPYVVRPLGVLNRWGLQNRRAFLKRLSLRLLEIPLLRRAAALHFTAEAEAEEASQVIPEFSRIRRAIIPVPVESIAHETGTAAFQDMFPEAANRKIILYLSRIDPKKGIELLLEAFASAIESDPRLVLVIAGAGEAGYVQSLRDHVSRLGLNERVLWTGQLEGDRKHAAFAAAALFILVSASENFGIAPAEALAAGIPTIVSEEVAISADVRRYGAGLVVARDAARVAAAILTLLADKEVASQMGANARRLVEENYSLEQIGRALADLYRSVISRSGSPR